MNLKVMMILLPATYIVGSINFPIILFRLSGRHDPRSRFSGNAGVTNVYRQAGLSWAGIILLLDLGRAAALAWVALQLIPLHYVPWIGFMLILGNRFPCFHQFRGGKGVAGWLGFGAVFSPLSAILAALLWLVVYGITRIPFIASLCMVAVLTAGLIIACGYHWTPITGTTITALFICANHRSNMMKIIRKVI